MPTTQEATTKQQDVPSTALSTYLLVTESPPLVSIKAPWSIIRSNVPICVFWQKTEGVIEGYLPYGYIRTLRAVTHISDRWLRNLVVISTVSQSWTKTSHGKAVVNSENFARIGPM